MGQSQTRTKVERSGDLVVLRFEGDITSASREAVIGTYESLDKSSCKRVLLDFQQVPYLNSSGIALVIQMVLAASGAKQQVHCFGLTPHFQKVFTMVGLSKYARLHESEAAALAASS